MVITLAGRAFRDRFPYFSPLAFVTLMKPLVKGFVDESVFALFFHFSFIIEHGLYEHGRKLKDITM
jgi:hypothetical protein